jgi:hypothetical protein
MEKIETTEELIARLKRENANLKANQPKPRAVSLKVSAKGAVSIYGFGRFPLTVYRTNLEKLLAMAPELHAFIKDNEDKLVTKGIVEE